MSTLQIHITAGPQAGARLQLNQSPVSFGRSAENALVLDVPVVSRVHGELIIDETGQWVLVNHSQNGTRVNRKKAAKKPVVLTEGASIIIGDTEVFRVHLPQPVAQEAGDFAPAAPAHEHDDDGEVLELGAPGTGIKGRSKLWIGVGIWVALCIGFMIFLATLGGDDKNGRGGSKIFIPGNSIKDMVGKDAGELEIRRLLEVKRPFEDPDQGKYDNFLLEAREKVALRKDSQLFEAYRGYQLAMVYAPNQSKPLESSDEQQYDYVLGALSEKIYEHYMNAYRLYKKRDYTNAIKEIDLLRRNYYREAEQGDDLLGHIQTLRNAAMGKGKGK